MLLPWEFSVFVKSIEEKLEILKPETDRKGEGGFLPFVCISAQTAPS